MSRDDSSRSGKKDRKRSQHRSQRSREAGFDRTTGRGQDFTCLYCGQHVSGNFYLSGVRSRNHCLYCLHSRHVDLHRAGDRLAACKGKMRPIGLTFKRSRNKYRESGELMLIHLCQGCGRISINRIAADDLVDRILAVFAQSLELDAQMKLQLEQEGIRLLGQSDREQVEAALLGYSDR